MEHEIGPLPMTDEFVEIWRAAGIHIQLRLRDVGGRWLRAELPLFREHLSFTFGNQLFFVQVLNVDGVAQPWVHLELLQSVADDANGIACVMPMRKTDGKWHPVERNWGLVGLADDLPFDPIQKLPTDREIITDWEVHDIGVQMVREYLARHDYEIKSWQSDIRINPSITCFKEGVLYGIVVRTSRKGPDAGARPENATSIAATLSENSITPLFVGLKIAGEGDFFDPRLEHLTRRIFRGEKILSSTVELQALSTDR